MALVEIGDDSWLSEHDACERLGINVMELTTNRSRELPTSHAYSQLSGVIRQRLKQYSSQVQSLRDGLIRASSLRSITQQEAERRMRLVETLLSKEKQLNDLFSGRGATGKTAAERSKLLGTPGFADLGTTGWGNDDGEDTEETRNMTVGDLKTQQQRLIEDQDAGLDALSSIITRQKLIARTVGDEVDLQNEIIDDLADHMGQTNERLIRETRQVRIITRKDSTWGLWVVIIILLVAIVVVAVV